MCKCCGGTKSQEKYKKFAFLTGHDHDHDHDHPHGDEDHGAGNVSSIEGAHGHSKPAPEEG